VALAISTFSALIWWKLNPRLGVVNLVRGGAMFVARSPSLGGFG
jgi:hypothetical protein